MSVSEVKDGIPRGWEGLWCSPGSMNREEEGLGSAGHRPKQGWGHISSPPHRAGFDLDRGRCLWRSWGALEVLQVGQEEPAALLAFFFPTPLDLRPISHPQELRAP